MKTFERTNSTKYLLVKLFDFSKFRNKFFGPKEFVDSFRSSVELAFGFGASDPPKPVSDFMRALRWVWPPRLCARGWCWWPRNQFASSQCDWRVAAWSLEKCWDCWHFSSDSRKILTNIVSNWAQTIIWEDLSKFSSNLILLENFLLLSYPGSQNICVP